MNFIRLGSYCLSAFTSLLVRACAPLKTNQRCYAAVCSAVWSFSFRIQHFSSAQRDSLVFDSSLLVYPCRVANQGLTPKLEAVLPGFSNFRFRLFSGWNFVIDFLTITFLAEPKLNPGVLEPPWTGRDLPWVIPGRVNPRWFDRTMSSSEEETELLECGLLKTLGPLCGTRWFSAPFCLIDDGRFFESDFTSLWGMFFTSLNTLRSSPPTFERGEGSKQEKNVYYCKPDDIQYDLHRPRYISYS